MLQPVLQMNDKTEIFIRGQPEKKRIKKPKNPLPCGRISSGNQNAS